MNKYMVVYMICRPWGWQAIGSRFLETYSDCLTVKFRNLSRSNPDSWHVLKYNNQVIYTYADDENTYGLTFCHFKNGAWSNIAIGESCRQLNEEINNASD